MYYTLHTMLPQNLESVSIYVLTKLNSAYIYTHMILILSWPNCWHCAPLSNVFIIHRTRLCMHGIKESWTMQYVYENNFKVLGLVLYWIIAHVHMHNIICHKNFSRVHVVLTIIETNVKQFFFKLATVESCLSDI